MGRANRARDPLRRRLIHQLTPGYKIRQMQASRLLLLLALTCAGCAADSPVSEPTNCSANVSLVSQAAGISAYADANCTNSPSAIGCLSVGCRLCRLNETEQSKFYNPCPGQQEVGVATVCPVDVGDSTARLSAFYDSGCASGGIGCQANNCRFCKTSSSIISQFILCPSGATTTPSPSPATESDDCSFYVASSGLVAVSSVQEATCNSANPRFVGCVAQTKCQLCRTGKNEGNQYLVSCKVLQDSKKTESEQRIPESSFQLVGSTESLAFLSKESESSPEGAHHGHILWVFVGTIAAMAAVAAVYKAIRSREKHDDLPSTPLGGSFISAETCISTL